MNDYIEKEKLLLQDIPNLSFSSIGKLERIHFYSQGLSFEIHLQPRYPHQSPSLICTSVNTFPSISDGRDLLPYIADYSPSSGLLEIIKSVPSFLSSYSLAENIGSFSILSLYPLDIWNNKESMTWFYCTEIDPCNQRSRKTRIISVTHSHILILEPHKTALLGVLVFWANLFSVASIKRCKKNDQIFLIEWSSELGSNFQMFKSNQCKNFVQTVSQNLKRLGSIVENSYFIEIEDNEDVIKIFETIRKIEKIERLIETVVDAEQLISLIGLYQKAIEYLSENSDPRSEIYINKLKMIFNDVRVLRELLGGMKKESAARNRIKSIDYKTNKEGVKVNRSDSA